MFEDIKNSSDWQSVDKVSKDGQAIVNTLLKQKKERCYCLEYQIWNNMKQRKKNMRL